MLKRCIEALALNGSLIDEVIVSDDGSSEGELAEIKRAASLFPGSVKIVGQEDRGYRLAAARNNGFRNVSGDYIISIDCDIIMLPGAVDAHLRNAGKGRFLAGNRALAQPEATAVILERGCDKTLLEEAWAGAGRLHLKKAHRQFVKNSFLRKIGLAKRHKPKILGCHFSLFKEDLESVNGFDENYEGWGLEDDDLAMRLHMAGVKGRSVILEARALHLWHESVQSMPADIGECSNYNYFKRQNVPVKCVNGLVQNGC